jgi:hypothetical protein
MTEIRPLTDLQSARFERPDILNSLTAASRQLAEFKGVAASMPNQGILINTLGLQEAKDSSAIENIVTTHDELFRDAAFPEAATGSATKDVAHYRQAVQVGFEAVTQSGHSNTLKRAGTNGHNHAVGRRYRVPDQHAVVEGVCDQQPHAVAPHTDWCAKSGRQRGRDIGCESALPEHDIRWCAIDSRNRVPDQHPIIYCIREDQASTGNRYPDRLVHLRSRGTRRPRGEIRLPDHHTGGHVAHRKRVPDQYPVIESVRHKQFAVRGHRTDREIEFVGGRAGLSENLVVDQR